MKILQGYIVRNEGRRHETYCPTTKITLIFNFFLMWHLEKRPSDLKMLACFNKGRTRKTSHQSEMEAYAAVRRRKRRSVTENRF